MPLSQISTRAGAVLARRDLALEGRVVERVILDVDGEPALAGLERHALRHRPARERAVPLEPEVVVEPPRGVALDDEDRAAAAGLTAERLRRRARIALAPILVEAQPRHHPRSPAVLDTVRHDRAFSLLAGSRRG